MIKSLYPQFQRWSETGSIYIISDTHFDDVDCKYMDPNWISPKEHMDIIKRKVHKGDTLIHLGDVGDPSYLDELKCYKVLITGNHDVLSKMEGHFDEIYTGPLFIADRILLSHEPIFGLSSFTINIHGHNHNANETGTYADINLAANVYHFRLFNLGAEIKNGLLSKIENIHRGTIDNATQRKLSKGIEKVFYPTDINYNFLCIADACKSCPNHPSNGGSGICNCTLGDPIFTC